MGFLDKAKAAAEQAASKAQEGAEGFQVKRDLTQAYSDLGRTAYSLVSRNEISHPELAPLAERVTELESRASAAGPVADGGGAAPGAGAPQQPPAGADMPAATPGFDTPAPAPSAAPGPEMSPPPAAPGPEMSPPPAAPAPDPSPGMPAPGAAPAPGAGSDMPAPGASPEMPTPGTQAPA